MRYFSIAKPDLLLEFLPYLPRGVSFGALLVEIHARRGPAHKINPLTRAAAALKRNKSGKPLVSRITPPAIEMAAPPNETPIELPADM